MISNKHSRGITVRNNDYKWKVSKNGKRHLVIFKTVDEIRNHQLVIVVNFPVEFKKPIIPRMVKGYICMALDSGWGESMPRVEYEHQME